MLRRGFSVVRQIYNSPKKSGGHVTPDSGTEWHTAIRPHAGRSRPHLSLREGSERGRQRQCLDGTGNGNAQSYRQSNLSCNTVSQPLNP